MVGGRAETVSLSCVDHLQLDGHGPVFIDSSSARRGHGERIQRSSADTGWSPSWLFLRSPIANSRALSQVQLSRLAPC